MAREVFEYHPLDLEPNIGIGILLPFNSSSPGREATQHYTSGSLSGGTVFNTSYTTEEQSVSNLKNLLMTKKGERYFLSDFYNPLFELLFENVDSNILKDSENKLREIIEKWLPYIIIDNVVIEYYADQHTLTAELSFKVTNTGANRRISIFFNEGSLDLQEG